MSDLRNFDSASDDRMRLAALSATERAKTLFCRALKPSLGEWVEELGPALDEFASTILEDLRDRAIEWAITVCDHDARDDDARPVYLDCIPTEHLAEWYQIQSGLTFYAYPDACRCRNPKCGGHQSP